MQRTGLRTFWTLVLILVDMLLLGGIIYFSRISQSGTQLSITLRAPHTETNNSMAILPDLTATVEASGETFTPETDAVPGKDLGFLGSVSLWSSLEIQFPGFIGSGVDSQVNPFTIPVDLNFYGPEQQVVAAPAFYDGDGNGGQEGNVWKVRFLPRTEGNWRFQSASSHESLNGWQGEFEVSGQATCNQGAQQLLGLKCRGLLGYTGEDYLRFEDGEYWLKTGIDDPENFLGTAFGDWHGKETAVDYLSENGVNSIYVILNNIEGDRNDTWPWLGDTPDQAKLNSDRFDIAKLAAWEDFFTYVQSKGLVLHLVLNDDSAWHGYDHDLYLREMVARFAHHPGIIWNIGEEANEIYSDFEQQLLAGRLQQLDSYDHPVTVHRRSPWPFLGETMFDLASIQVGDGGSDFSSIQLPNYNEIVIEHRDQSRAELHPIPVMIDEIPRLTNVSQDTRNRYRTQFIYPVLLAGGAFELHYRDAYGQGGTLTLQDLAPILADMRTARQVIERLPFQDMATCNDLLSAGDNLCFGKIGKVYLVYFPGGGSDSIDLAGFEPELSAYWIDPLTGKTISSFTVESGNWQTFNTPDERDWLLLVQ